MYTVMCHIEIAHGLGGDSQQIESSQCRSHRVEAVEQRRKLVILLLIEKRANGRYRRYKDMGIFKSRRQIPGIGCV